MDRSKISFGEMVAGASGLALFIFMFIVSWFTVEDDPSDIGNRNAWEAFTLIDILLCLVVLTAVGLAVARMAGTDLGSLPAPPGLIVAGAGGLAVLLILFRVLITPDLEIEVIGQIVSVEDAGGEVNRGFGLFLGLVAAAGIAFGGYTAMNERASGQAPRV